MSGLENFLNAISQHAPAFAVMIGFLAVASLVAIALRLSKIQQSAGQELLQITDEMAALREAVEQRLPLRFALAALIAKHKDDALKPEHLEEELEKLMADWESLDYAVDDLLRKVERAQLSEDHEEEKRGRASGR